MGHMEIEISSLSQTYGHAPSKKKKKKQTHLQW